jgi:hypothetical protein
MTVIGPRHGRLVLAAALTALVAGAVPGLVAAQTEPRPGPTVTFDSGPQDPTPTNDPTPTFAFSSSDPHATFECALDSAPPVSCSSPHTTALLADGPHLLEVRATDRAGRTGSWAARAFTVDTTAPETVLVTTPPAQTTDRTPLFEFSASEAGATFECSVDGGAFAGCPSPWRPGPLLLGPHRVAVRALDALGNADLSPATAEFTVADAVAPDTGELPAPAVNTALESGVRMLSEELVLNLDRVVRALRTSEMPTILRHKGLTVRGITALVPGTLDIVVHAPTRSGTSAVLRGSRSFEAKGSGSLALRPTRAGRDVMRRFRSVPVLLAGRFSSSRLSLAATHQAALVRDWLTAREARRAVAAALLRRQGARPGQLAVRVVRRCGSSCLALRAVWDYSRRRWTTTGRARQVDGELRAALRRPVPRRH